MDFNCLFPEVNSEPQFSAGRNPSPPTRSIPMTYAESVKPRSVGTPTTFASKITDEGGFVAVKVSQQAYDKRLELCKFSLIGCVTLLKGELPWKHNELKTTLNDIWGLKMDWKLISIGKGFYHILMNNEESLKNVWGRGSIALKPGILRLMPWSPGFDPENHKSTSAQVWVRIFNLPWEFWDKQLISDIVRGIGVPLKIDKNTIDGELGHFARVLVDVDLKKLVPYTLRVNTDTMKIWVNLVYENLPEFCSTCQGIGHSARNYRRNTPKTDDQTYVQKPVNYRTDKEGDKGSRWSVNADRAASRGRSRGRRAWRRKSPDTEVPVQRVFARFHDLRTQETKEHTPHCAATEGQELSGIDTAAAATPLSMERTCFPSDVGHTRALVLACTLTDSVP